MKDAGLLEVVAKFIPLFCELHPGLDSEESLRLQTSSWEFLAVLGSPRLLVPSQDPNVPGPHTVVPAQIWRQLLKALAWFCTHFSPRALCEPCASLYLQVTVRLLGAILGLRSGSSPIGSCFSS